MRPSGSSSARVRQAESPSTCSSPSTRFLGGMCTVHANSAREAVTKMCTLPLLAGENVGSGFVVPTVAGSIDIVVHIALSGWVRRVREIVAVPGGSRATSSRSPTSSASRWRLTRGDGFPPHVDRFRTRRI